MSGQAEIPEGFNHWLLKFDGTSDIELGDTSGFARVEYAYYQMAKAAGIDMMESRLLEKNGRAHVMPSPTMRWRTAAHLVEHVFPRVPVRQWVISFPKRPR